MTATFRVPKVPSVTVGPGAEVVTETRRPVSELILTYGGGAVTRTILPRRFGHVRFFAKTGRSFSHELLAEAASPRA